MNKTKEEIDMWKEIGVRFSQLYNRGPALLVKTQRMFPNCSKYKKCCTDDKLFWRKLDEKLILGHDLPEKLLTKNVSGLYG